MALISQPLGVLPVHVPLIYFVSATIPIAGSETLKNVIVTVTNQTTGDTFTFRQSFDNLAFGGGNITGTAMINLSAIGKTFFCNDLKISAFGILGGFYSNLNPESIHVLEAFFRYEKVNSDGILEDLGIQDNATDITLLNAVRDICDPQDLDKFILPPSNRCLLTNRPEVVTICIDDNDFVQYWTDGINAVEVKVYPFSSGLPRAEDIFTTGAITAGTVASVGVGPVNINAAFTWISGGLTIMDSDFKYTIQLGFYDGVGLTFTPVTELKTFNVKKCCEDTKCSLSFLNRLGGVDRFTFDAVKIASDNPTSATYEKVRNTLGFKEDYGRQKYDSRDKNILTLESRNLCEEESTWLRELQTSTRVYKNISEDECISVVIRDIDTIITDKRANLITKRITLEYSVDPCIQNNI